MLFMQEVYALPTAPETTTSADAPLLENIGHDNPRRPCYTNLVMETIIISVGGSLIVPDAIDTTFLHQLRTYISEEIATTERRFILIAGGGRTARNYQKAAAEVSPLDAVDIDWLGIHATRLNGHLLRTIFRDIAHPTMITNPDEVVDIPTGEHSPRVIIASGYRPGASTDLRAVQIALRTGSTHVVNLSNTDYVYTADPKVDPDAKPIERMPWHEFRKLIPSEWAPGLSSPFDPVAAQLAEEHRIEVACINGTRLTDLLAYLNGEPFVGTLLTPA